MRWLLFKSGLGATNHFETLGFIRSRAGVEYPDIQFHLLPLAMNYDGTSPFKGHGFQFHVGPMRSASRGYVNIKSRDPKDHPEIVFNYMSKDDDWRDFRNCIRLSREILSQPGFKDFLEEEIQPGVNVESDEEIDEFIKNNPDLVKRRLKQVVDTDSEVFLNVFKIYAKTEMLSWLKNISKPCLLLTGEHDGGCSPKHNEIMANEIKDSKLVILPKYKHSFLIEAPNEVTESLIEFINE